MLETKAGRIGLLIFMVAVLVYTTMNYARGETSILMLGMAMFIVITSGSKIVESLIDDFKKGK